MAERPAQPPSWVRPEARRVYGEDPEGYDTGRPDYPDRVYELLGTRCGIGPGSRVVEIGPGTGQVTRRLVGLGATVTAVEPDQSFAGYLTRSMAGQPVDVVVAPFEDATLEAGGFDAVVAAMSFHWVDQDAGLAKAGHVLKAGGWLAVWWTVFGDPERPDPFYDATKELLRQGDRLPPQERPSQFELDVAERTADLRRAGFADVDAEMIPWTIRLDTEAVRRLYATMIRVRTRPPEDQLRLLDGLARVAADQFGGVVERPFVTVIYTGRRP